jgi:guanylate kinase
VTLTRPAFPVVLAAPSGAGKTTLVRKLIERIPDLAFSLSATTRPPRPGERDGRDYHFVDDSAFDRMIARNDLVEWAVVHGRRYGTPRREVTGPMEAGRTVLLDIDVQGARQVKRIFPGALLIFVLPPSARELDRRLTDRASEDPEQRRRRLANARRELDAVTEFDYAIVNENVDRALDGVEAIVRAEWSRVARIPDLDRHAGALLHELDALISDVG